MHLDPPSSKDYIQYTEEDAVTNQGLYTRRMPQQDFMRRGDQTDLSGVVCELRRPARCQPAQMRGVLVVRWQT